MADLSFNPSLGSQFQFSQIQQIGVQNRGNVNYQFLQVNAYTGYLQAFGQFGQVNLFVNPANPFGNAQQYLQWSGLYPKTLGELQKILSVGKKEGNKTTAMDIIKVIFEGVGKVTDFIRAWKGERGIDYNNTGWTPSDIDPMGAGGGGDYNPYPTPNPTGSIGDWISKNQTLVAIVVIGGIYLATKK